MTKADAVQVTLETTFLPIIRTTSCGDDEDSCGEGSGTAAVTTKFEYEYEESMNEFLEDILVAAVGKFDSSRVDTWTMTI